mmetsp:Transcript_33769/g.54027  ORF Transcript_33769/g.54027 Transcript_33769/m.54027 type:complete len:118 (-) Transcript_33769:132-485(-)
MQFRQITKIGHRSLRTSHANRHRIFATSRRNIVNYQHNYNLQGWEIPMLQATLLDIALCTWVFSFTPAAEGWINKVFCFSFGKPRQGAYYPPHCRYVTPYEDMVRNHKRKQREAENQ